MSQIDISQWKEFKVGKLFDVIMPKHVPNKSELAIKADHIHKYPLINAQTINNGIAGFALPNNNIITDVPALTIGSRGSMESFVQENPFILGNSCIGLIPKFKHITLTTLLFLASNIFITNYKGHNGYQHYPTKTRLEKKDYIFLPVDSNGDPDWQYMDTYIAKLTTLAHKNVSSLKQAKAKPAKLNIDQWGEFKISDILSRIPVKKTSYKATDLVNEADSINTIPLVAAGVNNQGVTGYAPTDNLTILQNCLTVSANGANSGTVFYQNRRFSILQDAYALELIDKAYRIDTVYIYLASLLTKLLMQNDWTNKATWNIVKDKHIKLPIDAKGKPDWEYMNNQVCHLATLSNLTITSLDPAKLPIFVGEWKEFKINKLFTIQTGTDLIMRNLENGKYPLVTHSQENNGITKYISKLQNRQLYDHTRTLSVADRGTFFVAHQISDFYIGTRVKVLIYKDFIPTNDNIALFLATSINKLRDRFYNYAENATNRLPDSLIRLPANFNGDPDWQYMDQYINWIKQCSKNKLTLIQ